MLSEGEIGVPAGGMQAVPRQLADRARSAGATIETDAPVTELETHEGEVTAEVGRETVAAESAVVATDPQTASELTDIDAIPTEPVGCVTQYFAQPTNRAPATGQRIILNATDDRPNTVAPLSAVASEYAPAGMELYSATFRGTTEKPTRNWPPQSGRRAVVVSERESRGAGTAPDRPRPALTFRAAAGDGTRSRTRQRQWLAVLAGDYTRWSAIQGALESGKVAADLLR